MACWDGVLHSLHSTPSGGMAVRHCARPPSHLYCKRTRMDLSLALHPDMLRHLPEPVRKCRRTSEGSPARRPQGERGPTSRPLSAVPLRESMEQYPSRLLSYPAMQVTLAASCLCTHCPLHMTSELQICPFCPWAGQEGLDKLSDDAVPAETHCAPWKLMALQQSLLSGIPSRSSACSPWIRKVSSLVI